MSKMYLSAWVQGAGFLHQPSERVHKRVYREGPPRQRDVGVPTELRWELAGVKRGCPLGQGTEAARPHGRPRVAGPQLKPRPLPPSLLASARQVCDSEKKLTGLS